LILTTPLLKFPIGLALALGLLCYHCSTTRAPRSEKNADLSRLVNFMVGDFSSAAQSERDSAFFDIRLHIRPIWIYDKANHWLYVEQATAAAESKPYRQRVYKIETDGKGGFLSIVYTLPNPETWAGKYKTPSAFDQLKPSELSLREGCTVYLQKSKDGSFVGSTKGEGCESTIRGAKYASSKVSISSNMLLSWDQGFNDAGEQVWGAVKSGYEFVKQ